MLKAQHSDALIKTVFFERFSRFIDWPANNSATFKIAVIGDDNNIKTELKRVYARQKIQDKPVEIVTINSVDEISTSKCHILFIAESEAKDIEAILEKTKNKPILTIGDTKGFEKKGIIINFYLRGESVHFKINEQKAKNSGFYISYHLLQIAEVIQN